MNAMFMIKITCLYNIFQAQDDISVQAMTIILESGGHIVNIYNLN